MNLKDLSTIGRWLELKANTSTSYTGAEMKQDIQNLFKKTQQIKKQLTQWDFYHISQVIDSANVFDTVINQLLKNEAAIINTDTFIKNINNTDTLLARGDIVLKTNDNNITIIKAQRGGNFYPKKLTQQPNTNNFIIEYGFTSVEPTISEATVTRTDNQWEVTTIGQTITFNDISSTNSTSIYGKVYNKPDTSWSSITFEQQKTTDNSTIRPIIKMFYNNEEIYCDYVLNTISNNYQIDMSNLSIVHKIIIK